MHPVRLSIDGDWWDAYIYAGRLYLIQMDGTVWVAPWARLIDHVINVFQLDRLAAELAFVDARYLYGDQWARLVRDREIQGVLEAKFRRLASHELRVTERDLQAVDVRQLGRVAPEVVADVEIHRSVAYFGGADGLWAQHVARLGADQPTEKIWDCPLFRVRANRGVIALAAGGEGLFQSPAQRVFPRRMDDADPVVYGDFFSCGWLATNIYASSYTNAGTLAVFSEERGRRERTIHRVFETAVPDEALFDPARRVSELDFDRRRSASPAGRRRPERRATGGVQRAWTDDGDASEIVFDRRQPAPAADPHAAGLSWAGQDRVCQIVDDDVRVAVYAPRSRYFANRFRTGPTQALRRGQEAVAGDVTPFGVVVETDSDLFVLAEEGVWSLGFEPARWRAFSRATNYPNQLHVIADKRLEVYSFLTASLQELRDRSTPLGRASGARSRRA